MSSPVRTAALAVILAAAILSTPSRADEIPFNYVIIDPAPPADAHAKEAADIDGDLFPDMVVAGALGGGMYWYEYPDWTKHTIVPQWVSGYTTDMALADIDADGDLDVVTSKGSTIGYGVWWYQNPLPIQDPRIDLWVEHEIGNAFAHDVIVADFNQDQKLDVVVRHVNTTLFIQSDPNNWQPIVINTMPYEGIDTGDIDNDGDLDIVINRVWLENPRPNSSVSDVWVEHLVNNNWQDRTATHCIDFNEDGRLDVVYAPLEHANDRLAWYEAPLDPKAGEWIEHVIDPDVSFFHNFETADMNLDGTPDIVTAEMHQSSDPDEVSVYLNLGLASSFVKQVVGTTGLHNLQIADIGLDGDFDIIGTNWEGVTPLRMWENLTSDLVATVVQAFDGEILDNGDVRLSWLFETDGSIDGINVYRGARDTGRFMRLTEAPLDAAVDHFVDRSGGIANRRYQIGVLEGGEEFLSPVIAVVIPGVASALGLEQNVPNPFNPTTTIGFTTPEPGDVKLDVFNINGSRVRSLLSGNVAGGRYEVTWDGKDDAGSSVASGVYFYRLQSRDGERVRRMVLLK